MYSITKTHTGTGQRKRFLFDTIVNAADFFDSNPAFTCTLSGAEIIDNVELHGPATITEGDYQYDIAVQ